MIDSLLIRMTEKEFAEYLIREMTIDMSMDFHYTKECALRCCAELSRLATDNKTMKYLKKVQSILENK